MMYVDAVTRGIDDIPTISDAVRQQVTSMWQTGGIDTVKGVLRQLDPDYYEVVDLNNPRRVIHAVEICLQSGRTYSSMRTGQAKRRPFNILKVALDYPREQLFERINRRVGQMAANGMLEEARRLVHLRHLNSLNTVGFKEMFAYLDGIWDFPTACSRMAKNTRVYAKKQLTWLKRDPEVHWLDPTMPRICEYIISLAEKLS